MKKIAVLLFVFLFSIGLKCEYLVDHGYRLVVVNNTDSIIGVYYQIGDTVIREINEYNFLYAMPKDSCFIDSKEKWEDYLHGDSLVIFILSMDNQISENWEQYVRQDRVVKYIKKSSQDLKQSHRIVFE